MIRILLADDHEVVRHGLRGLLEDRPDWRVCGEAADGLEAVRLAEALRPDVAVLDLVMPALSGLEAARRIRQASPETEVLIFTMHETEELARSARAAGARGYVLKSDAARQLIAAVNALSQHIPFYTSKVTAMLRGDGLWTGREPATSTTRGPAVSGAGEPVGGAGESLTKREREVLGLLASPRSGKEIGQALEISPRTVKKHAINIYRKLHVDGRLQAVAKARALSLLRAPEDRAGPGARQSTPVGAGEDAPMAEVADA